MLVQLDAAGDAQSAFRTDIEGLRGVAVLMVVLGHAGLPSFAGGFIGVDVFFVISGFLITGLLLRELRRTSSIDFFSFYARRIRRLLPAFSVMAVCAMLAVIFVVPGTDQTLQASSGMWGALWSSNIFFSVADFGYFDASARDSIFLHTWSLGVEEQFYLIWPALLLGAWKLSTPGSMRVAVKVIAVVAAAGFVSSLLAVWKWPVAAYYLMPFRLWELAAGGFCCAVSMDRSGAVGNVLRYAGIPGWLLLVVGCVYLNEHMPYPGYWAMLPVAGAALLITSGTIDAAQPPSCLLATKPLMFVGRISYSWYLWHWPALIVARRLGHNDAVGILIAVVSSFAAAYMSYLFVERTTRYRRIADSRRQVVTGLMTSTLLALLSSLCGAATLLGGTKTGHVSIEQQVRAMISAPEIYSIPGCDEFYLSDRLFPCEFTSKEFSPTNPTAIVIGDSLALHLFPAFRRVFADAGWRLVVLTKSSCPIIDEPVFNERTRRFYTKCEIWRNAAIAYVQQIRPDLVVMGSADSYPFTQQQWVDGTRRILGQLKSGARSVVVLIPTPRLGFDGPNCAISHGASVFQGDGTSACTARLQDVEAHTVIDAIKQVVKGMDDVGLLDINAVICPQSVCSAVRDGQLVYRDQQHLNAQYAAGLAGAIATQLAPYMRESRASDRSRFAQ